MDVRRLYQKENKLTIEDEAVTLAGFFDRVPKIHSGDCTTAFIPTEIITSQGEVSLESYGEILVSGHGIGQNRIKRNNGEEGGFLIESRRTKNPYL